MFYYSSFLFFRTYIIFYFFELVNFLFDYFSQIIFYYLDYSFIGIFFEFFFNWKIFLLDNLDRAIYFVRIMADKHIFQLNMLIIMIYYIIGLVFEIELVLRDDLIIIVYFS